MLQWMIPHLCILTALIILSEFNKNVKLIGLKNYEVGRNMCYEGLGVLKGIMGVYDHIVYIFEILNKFKIFLKELGKKKTEVELYIIN